jgi:hypothetical protein
VCACPLWTDANAERAARRASQPGVFPLGTLAGQALFPAVMSGDRLSAMGIMPALNAKLDPQSLSGPVVPIATGPECLPGLVPDRRIRLIPAIRYLRVKFRVDGGGCPRNRGGCPRNRGGCPRNRGGCPRNRGGCPRNRGGCPRNRGGCPRNRRGCPHNSGGCPRRGEGRNTAQFLSIYRSGGRQLPLFSPAE